MAYQKIIIEHQGGRYSVYIETPAMPVSIKSRMNFCYSREEVIEALKELLGCLPGLVFIPEEVKKVIEKYNKEKIREKLERSIAGID